MARGLQLAAPRRRHLIPRHARQEGRQATLTEQQQARAKKVKGEAPVSALERLANIAIGLTIGFALEEAGMYAGEERLAPDNAYSRTEMRQFKERLRQLVDGLPAQERTVIYSHYLQQQPFEQIARTLGLSKGRVSQIHTAGLERLRQSVSASS